MYATDFAVELSAQGKAFRDAYQEVVERYDELQERTAKDSLEQRTSPGGCADLQLDTLIARYKTLGID